MRFFVVIFISFFFSYSFGQQGITGSGGDISSSGGSVSYSLGQIDYGNPSSSQGTIFEGLQVPYEIYVIVGLEERNIDLTTKVYPNPTDSRLYLFVSDVNECWYQLYSLNGALLKESDLIISTTEINLETFASTSFLLRVYKDNLEIKSFKIIKR